MKKVLLVLGLAVSVSMSAQELTGKKGNTINVNDYETITVWGSSSPIYGMRVEADGYEELVMNKKSIIVDGERILKGKQAKKAASSKAFWMTYLKKRGYILQGSEHGGGGSAIYSNSYTGQIGSVNKATTTLWTFIKE